MAVKEPIHPFSTGLSFIPSCYGIDPQSQEMPCDWKGVTRPQCHVYIPLTYSMDGVTKWMFFALEICRNLNIVLIWSELFSSSIRIIPFQRPLKFKDLLQKVMEAFGQQMDLYYTDKEVVILVTYCNLFVVKCQYRELIDQYLDILEMCALANNHAC